MRKLTRASNNDFRFGEIAAILDKLGVMTSDSERCLACVTEVALRFLLRALRKLTGRPDWSDLIDTVLSCVNLIFKMNEICQMAVSCFLALIDLTCTLVSKSHESLSAVYLIDVCVKKTVLAVRKIG